MAKKWKVTLKIFSLFQGPTFELNTGTGVQFLLKEASQNAIELGAAIRLANRASPTYALNNQQIINEPVDIWTDALIFNLVYYHQKIVIGLSYDLNVSDLKIASNGNGAYEMALVYRFGSY